MNKSNLSVIKCAFVTNNTSEAGEGGALVVKQKSVTINLYIAVSLMKTVQLV